MTDHLTPEAGGWTIRHHCGWERWDTYRRDAERALHAHKQRCKEATS